MPTVTDRASTSNVLVQCVYIMLPEEVPSPYEVCGWLEMTTLALGNVGIIRRLTGVTVIAPGHRDAPLQFRSINPTAGFYDQTTNRIWLNGQLANWGCLAHEVGHHVLWHTQEQGAEAFRTTFGPQDRNPSPGAKEFFKSVVRSF